MIHQLTAKSTFAFKFDESCTSGHKAKQANNLHTIVVSIIIILWSELVDEDVNVEKT